MIRKIIFSIAFVCFGAILSFGQSSAELKKQRERIDAEIIQLQKGLRAKLKEKLLSQNEVSALSKQLNLREDKITTINKELQIISNQVAKNTREVAALEAELDKMRRDYKKMILFAFRNKNAYNKMMFIFASKDFNQGFKRVKYLQQFNDARKVKAAEIEATQKQIQLKLAQLERDKETQAKLLKEQRAERDVIAKDRSQHQQELNKLVREERGFQSQLTAKQQEKKRLDAAIRNAIAREVEAAKRLEEERQRKLAEAEAKRSGTSVAEAEKKIEKKTGSNVLNNTPEATRLSADFKSNRGRLPWPVGQGNIVSAFGRKTVERGVTIDDPDVGIRTASNAAVKAVFDGEVAQALPGLIVIRHGEFFTTYSNLKSYSVRQGQKVSRGQTIGTVDDDPDRGYPVLNFGVYQGQNAQDPSGWLAR
ncbi:murein hydrolase activator EnvC family protein [Sphingobacterium corticis]|uniref:Murein hydrolase activator EnvC family protein n=1 Tax=Sphingobacterium corticis TaxID=1812823 RepID=A0ABW5NHK2_9SPHI